MTVWTQSWPLRSVHWPGAWEKSAKSDSLTCDPGVSGHSGVKHCPVDQRADGVLIYKNATVLLHMEFDSTELTYIMYEGKS